MTLEQRRQLTTNPDEIECLDSLLSEQEAGRLIQCLDDGFVRLVDYMGSDAAVVQAARVSYGKGTRRVSDDRNLIRYLMRHAHTTPFEMVTIKFHIRITMDAWRQMVRHRTASINEYSTRYSEAIDSCQQTGIDQWRLQATSNKQGSDGVLDPSVAKTLSDSERQFHQLARDLYTERLSYGVAREQARKDLPLCNYTEAYWQINLHNLFHFLKLRMDSHAQLEIRTYANAIFQLIQPIVPISCEAFKDYRLDAMTLSGPEIAAIRDMFQPGGAPRLTGRELKEFEAKLARLGITV